MPLLWTTYVFLIFCLGGCNSAMQSAARPSPEIRTNRVASPANSPQSVAAEEQDARPPMAEFWHKRTGKNQVDDYPLGAGDALVVPVPYMREITSREARIVGSGRLTRPLVGTLQAEGLTEEALPEGIRCCVSTNYVYNSEVDMFVREYRSRQVAVIGAVAKPGLYRLASDPDTLLDVLSEGGGLTGETSQRIHFIPAEPVERGKALKFSLALLLKRSDPFVLSLAIDEMAQGMGSNKSALKALQFATNLRLPDLEAHLSLRQVCIREQNFDRAALALQKALEIRPGSAYAFFTLGLAQDGCYKFFPAKEAYTRPIEPARDKRPFRITTIV